MDLDLYKQWPRHDLQFELLLAANYDEISFERVRDEVDPVLGIVYRSRQIPIWPGLWDQTLTLLSPPGDLSDVSVRSSTRLSIPLSRRWSWRNEFMLRDEETRPGADYPQLRFQFSTGVNDTV